MFELEKKHLETQIKNYFLQHAIPLPEEWNWTPIPFSGEWGIATSFFKVAALEARAGKKVNVAQRAQEISETLVAFLGVPEGFSRVEAVKGYLNLYFSTAEYSRRVVDAILIAHDQFGRGVRKNARVMVEYSQPNTHKAFHVGHLRSAILGDVICRILDTAGYDVVRANYFGDIGLHVIKWLWNYMKYHAGQHPPAEDVTRWMGELYAEAARRLDENPEFEAEVREVYGRWDRDDHEIVALWKKTRQWSLDGFDEMYRLLNIPFDRLYANSDAEKAGKEVVQELVSKNLAVDERPAGPVIVKIDELLGLEKEKYRVFVVLRSDGTALYSTEDLALAKIKFSEYPDLVQSIYIVDVRQSLHFQQVFKTLELAGYEWATQCVHLPYELVNLPGNVTVSSREGTVVLLEDLIREATQRAREVVEQKNPALSEQEKDTVSWQVALGAIKYPLLARDNAKIATFDWETALDFEGQAAPYIQYAHVRANSILRKAGEVLADSVTPTFALHPAEVQLIDMLSRIPAEIQRAAAEFKTLHITNLTYQIAKAFSDFYNQCPVLSVDGEVRLFRMRLVAATRQALENLLACLGISAPEVM
ncbi:MAG: arginine--tRNA ligase [Anaerolineales bacterium]|nr:arginine--tRNA ligase [Anaerolineales bacterium]